MYDSRGKFDQFLSLYSSLVLNTDILTFLGMLECRSRKQHYESRVLSCMIAVGIFMNPKEVNPKEVRLHELPK